MTLQLVETVTVGAGGASSIEFTSIPQDGTDLLVKISGRTDSGTAFQNTFIKLNGESINQSGVVLFGNGSTPDTFTTTTPFTSVNGTGSTSNTFANANFYFSNYTSASPKSFSTEGVSENNAAAALQTLGAYLWNNTSAITSIQLNNGGSPFFVAGSTASLYKITAS
jgi:hypothetical protein